MELRARFPAGGPRGFADSLKGDTIDATLDAACAWEPAADETRLREVAELLTTYGAAARSHRSRRARVDLLRAHLKALAESLSGAALQRHAALATDAMRKREAARLLAAELQDSSRLAGVGGDPWRVLWAAARDYCVHDAYPGRAFPAVDDGARCPLCHQDLDDAARSRLAKFEAYVQSRIQQEASQAEAAVQAAVASIQALALAASADEQALFEELAVDEADLVGAVRHVFELLPERRVTALNVLAGGAVPAVAEVSLPLDKLANLSAVLEARAKDADAAATPEGRKVLETEKTARETRKRLAERKADLLSLRSVLQQRATLDACRGALSPRPVTELMKRLERDHITDPFRKAVAEELEELDVRHKVTLGFATRRAATQQRAAFEGTNFVDVHRVLSEGEHRAVALACFLAEVRQRPGNDPVIVDDPVSSLDHARRALVARRLARLGNGRQIIVFTHDIAFLSDLREACGDLATPLTLRTVRRASGACGQVENGEPWEARPAKERVQHIETVEIPALEKLRDMDDPSYEERAKSVGKDLRDTWERLVEDTVISGVVERFRNSVQTLKLRYVDVSDEVFTKVFWGVTRTSNWAHDRAAAAGQRTPTIKELKDEVGYLRACLEEANRGRKNAEKRRASLEKPPGG